MLQHELSTRASTASSSWTECSFKEAKEMVAKLKDCARSRDIEQGKALHMEAISSGLASSFFVANTLISMYGRCGSMKDAEEVFENMARRDVVTWNCLLRGYLDHEKNELALQVYAGMVTAQGGCTPDARTYVAAITACANLAGKRTGKGSSFEGDNRWLQKGRALHASAVASGCCDAYVQRSLLNMYTKFGSMVHARSVFDNMVNRDVISWTSLLQGYVGTGESELALELFERMEMSLPGGCAPNSRTYAVALTAVSHLAARTSDKSSWLEKGKAIHSRAVTGISCHSFLDTVLVNMYARCGSMAEAQKVFDEMKEQDVISWTALMQGYIDNGDSLSAVELFDRGGFVPDARTYVVALTACARLAAGDVDKSIWLEKGSEIHSRAIASHNCDMFVECVLIDMYGKCGDIVQARKVFDGMARRDVASWNCLIRGCVEHGMSEFAVELFDRIDCAPDSQTYVAVLSACASLLSGEGDDKGRWLRRGKDLHARALAESCCNRYVENMLINMYSVSSRVVDARAVFDRMIEPDVVSWNALLQGYVENEETELALDLFHDTTTGCSGFVPNEVTFVAGLGAHAKLLLSGKQDEDSCRKLLTKVKAVHSLAVRERCCEALVETMLIDLYGKCRSMVDSKTVFDNMEEQDLKAWSCLIQGYVENGQEQIALKLMDSIPETPDSTVYAAALVACGNLFLLQPGKAAHGEVERLGYLDDSWVISCVMGFYSKFGDMKTVEQVFNQVPVRQVEAWNCLMCGYSQQGDTNSMIELLERMEEEGVSPNGVTFTHVLSACSHAGLSQKGRILFEGMERKYSISPDLVHYTCMIDLLARGSYLGEALKIIERMAVEVDGVVWTSILAACSKSNNVSVGRVAYEALLSLNSRNLYQSVGELYTTQSVK